MSTEQQPPEAARTLAIVRRGHWPGWMFAIPLAAIAIVTWLMVRQFSAHGVKVTVTFDEAAQLDPDNAKVMERGVKIGKVEKVELAPDGSKVQVTLEIDKHQEKFLNSGTRFYLEGAKPSLSDLSSLKSVIGGPMIHMLPGGGTPLRHFTGIVGEAPEQLAVAVPYWMTLSDDAGALKAGAPVRLRGFTVGEVTSVALSVRSDTGAIDTRVGIALDPARFHIQGGAPASGDWTELMNATLDSLVAHGLRARLAQAPPVLGASQIELALMPGAAPAALQANAGKIEIPTVQAGSIERFAKAVGGLPIREIGDNVRLITQQLRSLSGSPQLRESIGHLNAALAQLDATLREAGPQVAPAVQSARQTIDELRHTAGDLDQAVKAARSTIGADPAAPEGSLQPVLLHVSEAARSIRVLADYLDQHPEALVRGRLK